MNSNGIKAIFVTGTGLLLALWLIMTVFGSGRNVIAALFVYLPFVCGVIGFLQPKYSVYLLFLFGAFAGLLKKFLVLDGRYGFESMYAVLGSPAILLLGACIGTALRMFMRGKVARKDLLMMVGFSAVCLLVMGLIFFHKRAPQLTIMGGAYVNVVWVMFLNFRDPAELNKLKWFTVVMMALSSTVGYYQAFFGLTPLDLQYLELGYVSNLGEFDPDNPRPFATYGSSGQFGWSMVFAVALTGALLGKARRDRGPLHIKMILLILMVILIGAVFCSQKKAPMVGLMILPFAVLCSRKALVAGASFALMMGTVFFIALNGDAVSAKLREWSFSLTRIDSNLSLNSFNARIESFEGILDTDTISLIGPGDLNAKSHSLITDVLLMVGYLPALALIGGGLWAYFWAQNRIGRMVGGWRSTYGRETAVHIGFFLALFAGSAMGTNAYQAFPGSLYWWTGIAYAALVMYQAGQARERARRERAPVDDPQRSRPPIGRFPSPGPRPVGPRSVGTRG